MANYIMLRQPCAFFLPCPQPNVPVPSLYALPPPPFFTVPFGGETLYVTVAKNSHHVHNWVRAIIALHRQDLHRLLVGLDTEWRPNLNPGEDHPIATLQLCVGNHCLIYQILHGDSIPTSLVEFLGSPYITFCGVGIEDDVKKLFCHHGLSVSRTMDLNELVKSGWDVNLRESYRYMGLKKMCLRVLNEEMKKPLNVTLSAWDAEFLTDEQVEYAAIDAFVSFKIAYVLCSARFG